MEKIITIIVIIAITALVNALKDKKKIQERVGQLKIQKQMQRPVSTSIKVASKPEPAKKAPVAAVKSQKVLAKTPQKIEPVVKSTELPGMKITAGTAPEERDKREPIKIAGIPITPKTMVQGIIISEILKRPEF